VPILRDQKWGTFWLWGLNLDAIKLALLVNAKGRNGRWCVGGRAKGKVQEKCKKDLPF
jgi:hypothetical protein